MIAAQFSPTSQKVVFTFFSQLKNKGCSFLQNVMAEHLRFISKVDNFNNKNSAAFIQPTICGSMWLQWLNQKMSPVQIFWLTLLIFKGWYFLNLSLWWFLCDILSPSGHFLPNPSLPAATPRPLNVFLRLALALTNLLLLLLPRPLIKEVSMLSNNFFSSKRVKLQSSKGWVSNLLHYKSLEAGCSLNTNELTQQKEAKRFSRSIRLDSKVPL